MDFKHKYYVARTTCLEMFRDRGYVVPQHLFDLTEMEFRSQDVFDFGGVMDLQNTPVFVIMYTGNSRKDLFVHVVKSIHLESVAKEKDDAEDKVKNSSGFKLIIIYDSDQIQRLESDYIGVVQHIEVFDVNHLLINPTKHIYQPKWRLMTEEEVTKLLNKYEPNSTSRLVLGSVCLDDPMNRYYGGQPMSKTYKGDVFEITRDGINIFYRKVTTKRMNLKSNQKS
jgi:DNA-directed RNA polymerase subunit H (RpoH/RPB5)